MGKSVAFAYSIAGLAVAAAIIVVAGSTAGLIGDAGDEGGGRAFAADVGQAGLDSTLLAAVEVQAAGPDTTGEDVEYVYVDAAPTDDEDDDHGDDDDHDRDDDDHDHDEEDDDD